MCAGGLLGRTLISSDFEGVGKPNQAEGASEVRCSCYTGRPGAGVALEAIPHPSKGVEVWSLDLGCTGGDIISGETAPSSRKVLKEGPSAANMASCWGMGALVHHGRSLWLTTASLLPTPCSPRGPICSL